MCLSVSQFLTVSVFHTFIDVFDVLDLEEEEDEIAGGGNVHEVQLKAT